jgi:hypothetical protein
MDLLSLFAHQAALALANVEQFGLMGRVLRTPWPRRPTDLNPITVVYPHQCHREGGGRSGPSAPR